MTSKSVIINLILILNTFREMGDQSKTLLTLTCLLGTWLLGFRSVKFFFIILVDRPIFRRSRNFQWNTVKTKTIQFTTLCRDSLWVNHSRIRPMVQLSSHTSTDRARFLRVSKLVRRNSMVSVGKNCRRDSLPRSNDDGRGYALVE